MTPEYHAQIASIGFAPLAIETRHCTPVTSAYFTTYSEKSAERTLTDCKPIALLQILEGIRSNKVLGEDVSLLKLAQGHDRFWEGEIYLDINTTPVAALLAIFPSTQKPGDPAHTSPTGVLLLKALRYAIAGRDLGTLHGFIARGASVTPEDLIFAETLYAHPFFKRSLITMEIVAELRRLAV